MSEGNNVDNKVKKILFNEISFLIAISGVIIGIVLFITGPDADLRRDIELIKKDVDVIRNNELFHLNENINKNYEMSLKHSQQIQELIRKVDRITYILENK